MSAKTLTSLTRWLLLVLVLCGAWVSGRMAASHDGGWHAGAGDAEQIVSPCGLRALPSAECTEVVESRWGSFDFYVGNRRYLIPTSLIGFAYFVFLGVWLLLAPPGAAGLRWIGYGWRLVTGAGFLGSIFLIGVMGVALDRWCPACLLVHVLNALLFFGVLWITRGRVRGETTDALVPPTGTNIPTFPWRVVGVASVCSIVAVLGTWLYFEAVSDAKHQWRKAGGYKEAYESLREDADLVMREFLAQPRVSMPERNAEFVHDDSDHPKIILFTDFDCPACACYHRSWREDLAEAGAPHLDVDVRFLPRADGDGQTANGDSESFQAALAAVAAQMQGGAVGYSNMINLLFAHRRAGNGRDYAKLARGAGLDVDRFLLDMDSPAVRERLEGDIALARVLGVEATPTVFVDGRRVPALCLNSKAFWAQVANTTLTSTPGERVSRAGEKP